MLDPTATEGPGWTVFEIPSTPGRCSSYRPPPGLCQDAPPTARRVPGSGSLNLLLLPGGAPACFLLPGGGAFSSRRREGRSHPSKRGAAPDTVALGDQIQTGTRRPHTAARVVPPLLMLDEHDPPFNKGGCFKHRPDQQHRASSPRRCAPAGWQVPVWLPRRPGAHELSHAVARHHRSAAAC